MVTQKGKPVRVANRGNKKGVRRRDYLRRLRLHLRSGGDMGSKRSADKYPYQLFRPSVLFKAREKTNEREQGRTGRRLSEGDGHD